MYVYNKLDKEQTKRVSLNEFFNATNELRKTKNLLKPYEKEL